MCISARAMDERSMCFMDEKHIIRKTKFLCLCNAHRACASVPVPWTRSMCFMDEKHIIRKTEFLCV